MERHPEKISSTGVVRADGSVTPFNAGDAVAAVAELYGRPIPRSFRARIGKDAKELLEDGFDPNIVCAAMLAALKLARPNLVPSIALEMHSAAEGDLLTFDQYRSDLRRLNSERNPALRRIHQALEEAFRK